MAKRKSVMKLNKFGLTAREYKFCKCYEKNFGDLDRTMADMGISIATARRILAQDNVNEYLATSIGRGRERLERAAPAIIDGLLKMFEDVNINSNVRATIGTALLDRAGLNKPTEPCVSININTEIADRARKLLNERISVVEVSAGEDNG